MEVGLEGWRIKVCYMGSKHGFYADNTGIIVLSISSQQSVVIYYY